MFCQAQAQLRLQLNLRFSSQPTHPEILDIVWKLFSHYFMELIIWHLHNQCHVMNWVGYFRVISVKTFLWWNSLAFPKHSPPNEKIFLKFLPFGWFWQLPLGKGSKIKLIIFAEFSSNGGVPPIRENNYFFKMLLKCSECSETWNKAIKCFCTIMTPPLTSYLDADHDNMFSP